MQRLNQGNSNANQVLAQVAGFYKQQDAAELASLLKSTDNQARSGRLAEASIQDALLVKRAIEDVASSKPELAYAASGNGGSTRLLSPDAKGAFLTPQQAKNSAGTIILKNPADKATLREEMGEAIAHRAGKLGLDVAKGDAGDRIDGGGVEGGQAKGSVIYKGEKINGVALRTTASRMRRTVRFTVANSAGGPSGDSPRTTVTSSRASIFRPVIDGLADDAGKVIDSRQDGVNYRSPKIGPDDVFSNANIDGINVQFRTWRTDARSNDSGFPTFKGSDYRWVFVGSLKVAAKKPSQRNGSNFYVPVYMKSDKIDDPYRKWRNERSYRSDVVDAASVSGCTISDDYSSEFTVEGLSSISGCTVSTGGYSSTSSAYKRDAYLATYLKKYGNERDLRTDLVSASGGIF